MARPYTILDVFTDTALSGNPLAVVMEAEGLSGEEMQRIAGEFNLSETVFVLPPENPAHTARVRIFTPGAELPFAGHPTVGTAVILAANRFGSVEAEQDAVEVLEEGVGPVRCGVKLFPGGKGFAEFDVPKTPEPGEPAQDKELIAAALGLSPLEIGFENHVPANYSSGVPFTFVPVRDLSVIGRAQVVPEAWNDGFGDHDHNNAFVYCRQTERTASSFHARMFAPRMGVPEDPATGAAAAAFAGVVNHFDEPPSGRHRYRIEQGFEMGRPSIIGLEIETEGGALRVARISGEAVVFARGELMV